VQLSKQIINATQKHFGKTVLGYELGNEVSNRTFSSHVPEHLPKAQQ
jgi:hypothetical protein